MNGGLGREGGTKIYKYTIVNCCLKAKRHINALL